MVQIEVLELIEKLRAQLIELFLHKPLVDPDLVELSQILDLLLNLYHHTLSQLF